MKKYDTVYLNHILEKTTRIQETVRQITMKEYLQNYLYHCFFLWRFLEKR